MLASSTVLEVRILGQGDARVLDNVAPGVFDDPVDQGGWAAFLADPRHMLAVAIDDGRVVGMTSAVEYFHPDTAEAELWINEVSVADSHRRRGLAREILSVLLAAARARGCKEAWVMTDRENQAAMRLYASVPGTEAPTDHVMFTFDLR